MDSSGKKVVDSNDSSNQRTMKLNPRQSTEASIRARILEKKAAAGVKYRQKIMAKAKCYDELRKEVRRLGEENENLSKSLNRKLQAQSEEMEELKSTNSLLIKQHVADSQTGRANNNQIMDFYKEMSELRRQNDELKKKNDELEKKNDELQWHITLRDWKLQNPVLNVVEAQQEAENRGNFQSQPQPGEYSNRLDSINLENQEKS